MASAAKNKERVVIIGAGPAGMSMAMYLKKAGYEDVLVLEKEDEVGGKAHSFKYKGNVYDVGANLTTPRYTTIRPLAKHMGLTLRTMDKRRVLELTDEKAKSLAGASPIVKTIIKLFGRIYVKFRQRTGVDREGYAGLPRSVRRPFGTWLLRRGLKPSRDLFSNLFVAYGYGPIMEEPAAYALKFLDAIHLEASLLTAMGGTPKTTKDFSEGFQELWIRIMKKFDIKVKTGVTVMSVSVQTSAGRSHTRKAIKHSPPSLTVLCSPVPIPPLYNFSTRPQRKKDYLTRLSTIIILLPRPESKTWRRLALSFILLVFAGHPATPWCTTRQSTRIPTKYSSFTLTEKRA